MNRTHLEGAAEALAAQQGYAFHTGPEDGMAHTVRSYPAAWLAPLELHAVEGCGHGRATYDMTLHLLSSGARLSPTERRAALARMEEQSCFDFMDALKSMGHPVPEMKDSLIHILCRSFFQQIQEFVDHDVPREEAVSCALMLGKFQHAGWRYILQI